MKMMILLWSSKYTEINATVTKGLDSGLLITFSLGDFEIVRAHRTILMRMICSHLPISLFC